MEYLLNAAAIRERCENIYLAGITGRLTHFAVDTNQLPTCVAYTLDVIRDNYPDLDIPFHSRWRHLLRDGEEVRVPLLDENAITDPLERARVSIDLAVTSVLLDAGAGPTWRYTDPSSQSVLTRSEGLAAASLAMFCRGDFSSDADNPLRADAAALIALDVDSLRAAFQVSDNNPLVGLEGRVALLNRLGQTIATQPDHYGTPARVGNLIDHLSQRAVSQNQELAARQILRAVLTTLGPVWPQGLIFNDTHFGDAWQHPYAGGQGLSAGYVPFHKLSQWLTYSLVEPIEDCGIRVTLLDELTGLPEYRNGGLFIDTGVLMPRGDRLLQDAISINDEGIVEWRALTVVLLDHVAKALREALNRDARSLPLARVLQGGTWLAGRKIAAEKRVHGGPPIRLQSDGTVF